MKGNTISKLALAVVSMATVAHSQTNNLTVSSESISTWGVQTNTPQWNQDLGVTYTRQGCPDAPASCLSFTSRIAASDKVKVVLAIPLNATTTAAYARQYSQLSLTSPFLAEISIDDFVDQYRALSKAVPSVNPAAVVAQVIANVKLDNPRLAFGATLYENDLANSLLQNTTLPAATRAKFDYIHLFIHYRENGPNYSTYVARAKALFPHAHIIAGSYAVDRRAFLPCAQGGTAECTVQQDFDLFTESLKIQVQELKTGAVDRIEFFPGYYRHRIAMDMERPEALRCERGRRVHRQHRRHARCRAWHPERQGRSSNLAPARAFRISACRPVWPISDYGFRP